MSAIRWHHASLTVAAVDPAIAFFSAVFGFEPLFIERGMRDDIVALTGKEGLSCDFTQMRSDAYPLILQLIAFTSDDGAPPEADAPPWRPGSGHVAFHVDDFDGVVANALTHGAEALGKAITFPGGRSIYLRAPGDAFFEIEYLAETA